MTDFYGYRGKVGLVVPSTNTTMEPEMYSLSPSGVTNHTARMVIQDVPIRGQDGVSNLSRQMCEGTNAAVSQLNYADPDVIIVGVSPEVHWNEDLTPERLRQSIRRDAKTDAPIVCSMTAYPRAIKWLGLGNKVSIITPYSPDKFPAVSRYWLEMGYEVVNVTGFDCDSPSKIAHISRKQIFDIIHQSNKNQPDVIVQIGTNVPMLDDLTKYEELVGIPILENNQVLYWDAINHLKKKDKTIEIQCNKGILLNKNNNLGGF